jgi:hypothetical protein
VCSASTAKLNTSSQKKGRANSQTPNTAFSQIEPVTMIAYSSRVLITTDQVAACRPSPDHR